MKNKSATIFCIFLFLLLLPSTIHAAEDKKYSKPDVQIDIPGLEFSDTVEIEQKDITGQNKIYLLNPNLGEYLGALYKYMVIVASILAVVMIIIAGFVWSTSGGNNERIKQAQKMISNSIIGLFLAVSSYVVLYTINPELVEINKLQVLRAERITLGDILRSPTPGDGGDWEFRNKNSSVSYTDNIISKITKTSLAIITKILPPPIEVAWAVFSNETLSEIKNFYNTNTKFYSKLATPKYNIDTTLDQESIQKGACLDFATKNLFGDDARSAAIQFGKFLDDSSLVSYAFYGRGAPCAIPNSTQKKSRVAETVCSNKSFNNTTEFGRWDCDDRMIKLISRSKAPWELDYCLDCSGFVHTAYKCGAKKFVDAKTEDLFACDPDSVRRYQPIDRVETIPGDIVGYKRNLELGIDVGHVMMCVDYGCSKVIHVHGPPAYEKKNIGQAVEITDENFLYDLFIKKLLGIAKYKNIMPKKFDKKNPSDVVALSANAKFMFEYRRIAVVDYKKISEIPLPQCSNIFKYSLCGSEGLKKLGACAGDILEEEKCDDCWVDPKSGEFMPMPAT